MIDRLTSDELYELTRRRHKSAQMEVLRTQGVPFVPDGEGKPVVLRCAVEAVLGAEGKPKTASEMPDWEALDAP